MYEIEAFNPYSQRPNMVHHSIGFNKQDFLVITNSSDYMINWAANLLYALQLPNPHNIIQVSNLPPSSSIFQILYELRLS